MVGEEIMGDTPALVVDGLVQNRLVLTTADFGRYPAEAQIADVSQVVPKREGRGVKLGALLAAARPQPEAQYITLYSSDGTFSASIERAEIEDRALLIYQQKDGMLVPESAGGPIRFVIPHFNDPCANVRGLGRIELSATPGRDTRPSLTQIQTKKKAQ
jgi:2-dehydropantoate 2-reductase